MLEKQLAKLEEEEEEEKEVVKDKIRFPNALKRMEARKQCTCQFDTEDVIIIMCNKV
jgi:hypothetical protein